MTISNPAGAGPSRIQELKSDCILSQIRIWGELVIGSQNNTSDKTTGVNNAVICYKQAVQFTASFCYATASFDKICGITIKFVLFIHGIAISSQIT